MKTWTFYKLVRLEELLERDILSVSRITGAWEVDSGFELELEGGLTLRIQPIMEDNKPKLHFEVIEGDNAGAIIEETIMGNLEVERLRRKRISE